MSSSAWWLLLSLYRVDPVFPPRAEDLEEEKETPIETDLSEKQKHQLRHRELFLSRQYESLPATHIRYTHTVLSALVGSAHDWSPLQPRPWITLFFFSFSLSLSLSPHT